MKRMLLAIPFLVAPVAPVLSQESGMTMADIVTIDSNWDLYSDDSYTASRAGCYEGLTRINGDLKVEPSLATSWSQPSPTSWEFQLREGVVFQDGTKLDADVVAGALNHLLNAPVPARAFSKKIVDSVKATGPMTVTISTKEPVVTLPGRLAAPAATILSPAGYKGDAVNPVGTCSGPFQITSVDAKQGLTLKAFDGYWGGKPALQSAAVRFIPDSNTRATMVRSGEAQIARMVQPHIVTQLKSDASISVLEVKAPRIVELLLNNGRPPFNDVRVRQAVKYAIDTAGISEAVYEGYAPPAGFAFRQGEPWTPKNAPPVKQDLEKAKALLKEAGVAQGSLNLTILVYNSKSELRDIAEILQAMLGEVGIKLNVRLAEYNALEPDMLSGNYDMALMSRGYLTDVPEPIGFLSADYSCKGSFNIAHFCDPAIDAKISAASAEPDPEKRYTTYAELGQYFYDNAVEVYLVNETLFDAVANKVNGYRPHPLNYYAFNVGLSRKQ